jgi:hypothetical protein
MDSFETGVNKQVLALTTDWRTKELGGDRAQRPRRRRLRRRRHRQAARVHERPLVLRPSRPPTHSSTGSSTASAPR